MFRNLFSPIRINTLEVKQRIRNTQGAKEKKILTHLLFPSWRLNRFTQFFSNKN